MATTRFSLKKDQDRGWKAIVALAKAGTTVGKVGWFVGGKGDAIHPVGKGRTGKLTNAQLAGVLHTARPVLALAFDRQQAALTEMGSQYAAAILTGKLTVKRAVGLMCLRFTSDVKVGVASRSLGLKANAPATVRRKGSDTPLIDRGRLINSLSWTVTEGGR